MYWKHFLSLERDLEQVSRYIEFNENNFNVFSVELIKLLLAFGSETDVILKALCHNIDPTRNAENINDYRDIILSQYPKFPQLRVKLIEYPIILEPWQKWTNGINPQWWKKYNAVKHDRSNNYSSGNLQEVLNASAGLFVANLYFIHSSGNKSIDRAPVHILTKLFDTENHGTWDPPMATFSYALLM